MGTEETESLAEPLIQARADFDGGTKESGRGRRGGGGDLEIEFMHPRTENVPEWQRDWKLLLLLFLVAMMVQVVVEEEFSFDSFIVLLLLSLSPWEEEERLKGIQKPGTGGLKWPRGDSRGGGFN